MDSFSFDDGFLNVSGWDYDESMPDAIRRIEFLEQDGRVVFSAETTVVDRADVAVLMGDIRALHAGFHNGYFVHTPRKLFVRLKAVCCEDPDAEEVFHDLGIIEPNVFDCRMCLVEPLSASDLAEEINRRSRENALEGRVEDVFEGKNLSKNHLQANGLSPRMAEIMRSTDTSAVLVISHIAGGGAEHYLEQQKAKGAFVNARVFLARFDELEDELVCEVGIDNVHEICVVPDIETVLNGVVGLKEIWVNELVTFPNLASVMETLEAFVLERGISLKFLVHDYHCLCQSFHLMNYAGEFCDLPEYEICNACFHRIRKGQFRHSGIEEYRNVWSRFLKSCDEITVFSESSRGLVCKVYPWLDKSDKLIVAPHDSVPLKPVGRISRKKRSLVVGVVGAVHHIKGSDVLLRLVRTIECNDLDVEVRIIGYVMDDVPELKSRQTGSYSREDLPALALREGIDVFFIASICPETYSFTTSEIMSMGYPVAVFDIGAPAERVARYDKGIVLRLDSSSEEILDALEELAFKRLKLNDLPLEKD